MANEVQRKLVLEQIRERIAQHGHYIYVVSGAPMPRFAYTIGLRESFGAELIVAGAYFYSTDEVVKIINEIAAKIMIGDDWDKLRFNVPFHGSFSMREVHPSWANDLMLGALDYYQVSQIRAFQLVPDEFHWTVDVPNLTDPWSPVTAPAWQWLHQPWTFPVPADSVAATNIGALRGERITEAMRWDEDEWELFAGAGPDVPKNEIRVVPLGILLVTDKSLIPVVDLPLGKGLWRDDASDWHPWGKSHGSI